MADVEVLFGENVVPATGGLVTQGTSGDQQQSFGGIIKKVGNFSAEHIADAVVAVANKIGPTLKTKLQGLSGIAVNEVSIGCAISAEGGVFIAGAGTEASLTITFKVS